MKVQAGILGVLYGVVVFTGSALGDLFEVKEAVEEAICKKWPRIMRTIPTPFLYRQSRNYKSVLLKHCKIPPRLPYQEILIFNPRALRQVLATPFFRHPQPLQHHPNP